MKILLLTAACVILCSCHALPTVPEDNSYYVEGESRYIWMPDGEGKPVLVDLDEPADEALLSTRNGANNQYWLYIRYNASNAHVLVYGNVNTIWLSNYVGVRPLKVVVHGWKNDANSEMNPLITSAFLAVQDVNLVVVDWRTFANSHYNTACLLLSYLAHQHRWRELEQRTSSWFQFGSSYCWNRWTPSGWARCSCYGVGPTRSSMERNINVLNRNAGRYVESIHTDGHILGIFEQVGDADFYPNGGKVKTLNRAACLVYVHMDEQTIYLLQVSAMTT